MPLPIAAWKFACFLTIAVIAVTRFAAAEPNDLPQTAPKPIVIGAIPSLTGIAAEQGKNWLNGARLAESELVSRGVQVRLVVEDDGTNPGRAVSAFRKMIDFDHVQIVLGGTWDFLAQPIYPLAQKLKVPFITMTNPIEILSAEAKRNPYVFTNALSLHATEDELRSFLKTHPFKRAVILSPDFPYTNAHASVAEKLAKEFSIDVAFKSIFTYDDYFQTLKVLAAKTAKASPDVVFIFTSAAALDPFLVQLHQFGSAPAIITAQHLDAAFALSADKQAYRNAFGVYPDVVVPDFEARYEAVYGRGPRVYAAEGYDAMMFAVQALIDGIDIANPKQPFLLHGVTGPYVLPMKTRQLGQVMATMMTTKNGTFEKDR